MVLGMLWLKQHDPDILPGSRRIIFNSDYCISTYIPGGRLVIVYGYGSKDCKQKTKRASSNIAEILAYAFTRMAERTNNKVLALWPADFERLSKEEDEEAYKLTTDIAAISLDDYNKFFIKIRKKPISDK